MNVQGTDSETPQIQFERVYEESEKLLQSAGYDSGYAEELGIGLGEYTSRKDTDYWHLEFISNYISPKRFEAESYIDDEPTFLMGNIRGFGGMTIISAEKWLSEIKKELDVCNSEKLQSAESRIKPWLQDIGYEVEIKPVLSENEDKRVLSLRSKDDGGYNVPNIYAVQDLKNHTIRFHSDGNVTTNYMDWSVKVKEFTEKVKFSEMVPGQTKSCASSFEKENNGHSVYEKHKADEDEQVSCRSRGFH